MLLLHEFIRGKENRVVKQSASAAMAPTAAATAGRASTTRIPTTSGITPSAPRIASTTAGRASARVISIALRWLDLLCGRCQLLPRRSQVLQQLDLMIEVDYKRRVSALAHYLIEERFAGLALVRQHLRNASAGVDEQSEFEWQVRLAYEVFDRLWTAVFVQRKILFGKIVQDLTVLVANGCQHVHNFYLR